MEFFIAPHQIHKDILSTFRKDPFDDIKILTKENLKSYIYPEIRQEAIFYLMQSMKLSFEVADMYLKLLPFVNVDTDSNKIKSLKEIYKKLEENNLVFFRKDIGALPNKATVIGYDSDDKELNHLLKELKIDAEYHISSSNNKLNDVLRFNKIEEEIYFVLNEIAKLVDSGVSINDIIIFRRNDEIDYYLNKFAHSFGFNINIPKQDSIVKSGLFVRFDELLLENKDIERALDLLKEECEESVQFVEFSQIVNKFKNSDLSFETQYEYLIGSLKKYSFKDIKFTNSVEIIDSPRLFNKKHIFVMGFAQGFFPASGRNDSFLNDDELCSLNLLTSKQKTKNDYNLLINFFQTDNYFHFSYFVGSLKGRYYVSPIAKALNIGEVDPNNYETFYSSQVLSYIYTHLKDLEKFYKETSDLYYMVRDVVSIPYSTYDNQFKGKANAFDDTTSITLSTTALDTYSHCPYKYYLSNVLKIDNDFSNFYMSLGIFAHEIIKHALDKKFDFELSFAEEISKNNFNSYELFLLNNSIKGQLLAACEALKLRQKYATNPKVYTEEPFEYFISKNTKVYGRIDFLELLDNKYVICVDYKTGSTKFDDNKLEYGISTQLPTYMLLYLNNEKFKEVEPGGLYINNIFTNSKKDLNKGDELIESYLKLNGKTLNNFEMFTKLDSTIAGEKSSFVSGVIRVGENGLKQGKSIISKTTFDSYLETIFNLYKDMDKNLRENNFVIRPIYFDSRDNACAYCSYKDICHVKSTQYKVITKEAKEE